MHWYLAENSLSLSLSFEVNKIQQVHTVLSALDTVSVIAVYHVFTMRQMKPKSKKINWVYCDGHYIDVVENKKSKKNHFGLIVAYPNNENWNK